MPYDQRSLDERRKYVGAFNRTMINIWREQITLLGAVRTGALYRSVVAVGTEADGRFTSVRLQQSFNLYGLYVDYGTGSNTPRGNPGDIGRANMRRRKPWFSRKYYASVMNIRDFFADNLGRECTDIVSNALTRGLSRRFVN